MRVSGEFNRRFAPAVRAFRRFVLPRGRHGGGQLSVYHRGREVVNVWGGTANADGDPWQHNTLGCGFSTTKGVASTLLHIAAEHGHLNYDDAIASHWEAFGTAGKDRFTIRQALQHEIGLHRLGEIITSRAHFLDWPSAIAAHAAAEPYGNVGNRSAYHAVNYGHVIGGILEHASNQDFGHLLESTLKQPLGIKDLYIGVPDEALGQCADLLLYDGYAAKMIRYIEMVPKPLRGPLNQSLRLSGLNTDHFRLSLLPDFMQEIGFNNREVVQARIPAANGMMSASALARMYAMIAGYGELDGTRLLSRNRVSYLHSHYRWRNDKALFAPFRWHLGYHQAITMDPKSVGAFGHFGFGGSGGWADPKNELAFGLTLNHDVGNLMGHSRCSIISNAVSRCL